jgi:hypothetical protein
MVYVTGSQQPLFVNPEDIIRGAVVTIRLAPFYSKRLQQESLLKLAPILMKMNPFINVKELSLAILRNDEYIEEPSLIMPDNIPDYTPLDLMNQQLLFGLRAQMMQSMIPGGQGQSNVDMGIKQLPSQPKEKPGVYNFDTLKEIDAIQGPMG